MDCLFFPSFSAFITVSATASSHQRTTVERFDVHPVPGANKQSQSAQSFVVSVELDETRTHIPRALNLHSLLTGNVN
jgi:hypothetical protein